MDHFAINFYINAKYRRHGVESHTQDIQQPSDLPLLTALKLFTFLKILSSNILILRTHIDFLMLGKCYQLSQLRMHDANIQITHTEHYRGSDNLFLNKNY